MDVILQFPNGHTVPLLRLTTEQVVLYPFDTLIMKMQAWPTRYNRRLYKAVGGNFHAVGEKTTTFKISMEEVT